MKCFFSFEPTDNNQLFLHVFNDIMNDTNRFIVVETASCKIFYQEL